MLLEGMQLGRYRLIRLLGSGGMGEVYLGEDSRIHRQIAIKVIKAETSASAYPGTEATKDAARLFEREVKAISALDHPHILPLFDYGEEKIGETVFTYMVMPYRENDSLATWLKLEEKASLLSTEDIVYMVRQAASALQYAHDRGIIHQDVKPSNFLIRKNLDAPNRPDLLLADFGVAKISSTTSSISHSIRGTPTYMAPEQWNGDPVPATDQYALAVMTYELLTGKPPFQGPPMRMMYFHSFTQPEPPGTYNPRLSRAIDEVLLKALAKQPGERFSSILEFANALYQAVSGQSVGNVDDVMNVSTFIKPLYSDQEMVPTTLAVDPGRTASISEEGIQKGTAISFPQISNRAVASHHNFSTGRVIIFVALALLVTLTSAGLFTYINKQNASSNTNTPATTQTMNAAQQAIAAATNTASTKATRLAREQANATATFQAQNADPYPPKTGRLALFDSLQSNNEGYAWDEHPTFFGSCVFISGAYHAKSVQDGAYHYCAARQTDFSNYAYEVKMIILSGNCGGIIFRADFSNFKYYYFSICQDGSYNFLLFAGQNNAQVIRQHVSNSAISRGLGGANLVAVVANGSILSLYVNNQQIDSLTDPTYSQGQIGVLAENDTSNPTEVVFSNARVWTL